MSGHSKWSTIKRKKGANDAERGKIFSRITKEIMIAVREGGHDPNSNSRLKTAIIKGQASNMPNSNIERAINKAAGIGNDVVLEELYYEGYAPGGVAILVECLTDNKNRTGPEVRHVFSKFGGNLGENGCVSYLFSRKGIIVVQNDNIDEETLFELVVEAGADDLQNQDGEYEIVTSPEVLSSVVTLLQEHNCTILQADISMVPETYISLDSDTMAQAVLLIEKMEEIDDVQNVSHNLEITE